MTIQEFLHSATKTLEQAGIASARLDTLILLEDALGRDRALLLADADKQIDPETEVDLHTKIAQRKRHTPLAYIRGKTEFYGRTFSVNQHVLVPRPETETMIDILKQITANNAPSAIFDIGTGSGAIAITAKLELPAWDVIAIDIDPECVAIARQNAQALSADVKLVQGDLLAPLHHSSIATRDSIILANLPYVPEHYAINQAAEHEPKHAIFSGKDGLHLYRRFWEEVAALSHKPTYILTESLPPQHDDLAQLAKASGYILSRAEDFIQLFVGN